MEVPRQKLRLRRQHPVSRVLGVREKTVGGERGRRRKNQTEMERYLVEKVDEIGRNDEREGKEKGSNEERETESER